MSNTRLVFGKKYSALAGELREVRENIARVRRETERLPALEARAMELEALVASAAMLLTEIDPGWQQEQTPPVKPFTHLIPVPFGTCGRRGLIVLRTSTRPMTAREIAQEVLRQHGVEHPDPQILQRTVTNVDATLRKNVGKTVERSGAYPAQWRSLANPDQQFDP